MWRIMAQAQMASAVGVWLMALWGVAIGRELFSSWLYFFAWWPLLLFLDGAILLIQGKSWLWHRPRQLGQMCFWSVTLWLIFEAYNLVLQNWRYLNVESRLLLRWPGYALAFATVLPGVLLTTELLMALGLWRRSAPLKDLGYWQPWFLYLGVTCLVLPLIAPSYAFPLIWLGFIFLLEPFCDLWGGESLTRQWAAGERQHILCLLTAGLLCGLWWELWNYPATSKWIYTLPRFDFGRIFEMPVLGYLGFPPFAVECAVMYSFFSTIQDRFLTTTSRRRWALGIQLAFWLMMFKAMDAWTVLSFQ